MGNRQERRNYYRILHVQPEAPHEIIVASYRSLMTKLRHHPDLGGDHETAARINEAYAVLSHPERRRAYDQARSAARHTRAEPSPVAMLRVPACPFCVAALPRVIALDTRCTSCDGPLAPIANRLAGRKEQIGRRTGTRVGKNDAAMVYLQPRTSGIAARLRDLSPTGISLFIACRIAGGTTVRIVSDEFDVLAAVVKVQPGDRLHTVHAKLLTACFLNQAGVFVSMSV
ncbi:MAG: J domain-containing protein [Gammaproteobacteria bacterium]|nr:J domain-containing protein [Gammaproteobacteria bacterium]